MNRGTYGQIKMETLDVELAQAVRAMVANAANAQKIDERGTPGRCRPYPDETHPTGQPG